MKTKIKYFLLFLFCPFFSLFSQELNCRVTVNSDKIQSTNKDIFTQMETAIREFMNNQKWTNYKISNAERIDCSLFITISEMPAENQFVADLQIQSVRPVYNASYTTTTFNFRDASFEFNFDQYEQLEFRDNNLTNNLTAVLAFYAYIILGVDFDSFSLYGGTPFFEVAMNIVNQAQSFVETGWRAFDKNNNRHAVASGYVDEQMKPYRNMWYIYHRQGLDDMAANAERGRGKITAALPALKESYDARPGNVVFTIFSDTKADEILNIYSKAQTAEKQEVYKLMTGLFPTLTNRLSALQR
ncbi:MAG: DUF4835 family protein [Candidatus Azobacteroides sp.]|nr:DUF4835 family protein [Candidatus Azobacteroides sp.]